MPGARSGRVIMIVLTIVLVLGMLASMAAVGAQAPTR